MENPVCPYCQAEMIKASIQDEEGHWGHGYWICDCEVPLADDDDSYQIIIHHSLYPDDDDGTYKSKIN